MFPTSEALQQWGRGRKTWRACASKGLPSNLGYLRKARLAVSIGFFLLVGALFLDFGNRIPEWLSTGIVSLQLIPSFLNLFVSLGTALLGLLVVVGLTAAVGRVYCSPL